MSVMIYDCVFPFQVVLSCTLMYIFPEQIYNMPKSKRDKKISLTRVEKKKGLETKAALVDKVRSAVDNYAR